MFNNLIESQSHGKEFKRQGRFLLATTAAYALAFFVIAVSSIYAYDAQLEAQSNDLTVLSWVPPVELTPASQPPRAQPIRRAVRTNAPVDRNITVSERISAVSKTDDPTRFLEKVGTIAWPFPPVKGDFHITGRNVDAPGSGSEGGCPTCTGNSIGTVVHIDEKPPEPVKVVPKTQPLTSTMLRSKAISLPQPQYPAMAKQARVQGPVVIQILVDESGRVVSAQVVSGNPMLTANAREAAMRARFTATVLNGQPVKVQGVITYNFVLQ
jgi:periplasmic protein TonB